MRMGREWDENGTRGVGSSVFDDLDALDALAAEGTS